MSLSKYQFVSIKPGYNGWGGLLFHNNKYYKKFVRSILKKVFINNYIFYLRIPTKQKILRNLIRIIYSCV